MSAQQIPAGHTLPVGPVETRPPVSKRPSACAGDSLAQHEPLAGTAGSAIAWLLVEHPGPWSRKPVEPALGPHVATEIERRTPAVRVELIRQPRRTAVERPQCYLVWTGGSAATQPWVRAVTIHRYDDLLALDLEALEAGREVDSGSERREPLYGVCTNGKRDACCAEFGRPVAAALAAEHDGVWECTHVGGHRFAANLVCFPHGLYYGRLTPIAALAVANAYRDGHVRLDNLRGRSGQHPAAQLAEHFVRNREQLTDIDAVHTGTPTPAEAPEPDMSLVDVPVTLPGAARDGGVRRFEVRLRRVQVGAPTLGGCDDRAPEQRFTWALESLHETAPSRF